MTKPLTVLPEDILEACDLSNAGGGSFWTPDLYGHSGAGAFNALCESIAELRELREEVDAKVRPLLSWFSPKTEMASAIRSLMLPDPEPDLWKRLADERAYHETYKETATRLGLKLVTVEKATCKTCNGEGRIPVTTLSSAPNAGWADCPTCEGKADD